jgi:ADP-heptose:LPS heptosyltransferase
MIDPRWAGARKILLIRLDNLGDVLVTTPAFHAVRRALPEAELTLLASPVGAQVGRLNPDLASVIVYEAPWMDPWCELPQDSARERAMIETLRGREFDAAIIFTSFRQSSLPAAYLAYLADIPLRLAASIDGPGSLLTTRHKHTEQMMHEVERGLDLVGAIGIPPTDNRLVLNVPDEAASRAARLLAELRDRTGQLVVAVHPGCTMPARTYPWEMYAEVGDLLVERLDARVVLTGTGDERELTEHVAGRMRHDARNLAGELSFPEFSGLIQAADLTITNNTGPMHVSAAVGTPVVALFALTNPPEQWGPWMVPHRQLYHDVPCRICYSRICPYQHECLRLVTPEIVLNEVAGLLRELSVPLPDRHASPSKVVAR